MSTSSSQHRPGFPGEHPSPFDEIGGESFHKTPKEKRSRIIAEALGDHEGSEALGARALRAAINTHEHTPPGDAGTSQSRPSIDSLINRRSES